MLLSEDPESLVPTWTVPSAEAPPEDVVNMEEWNLNALLDSIVYTNCGSWWFGGGVV